MAWRVTGRLGGEVRSTTVRGVLGDGGSGSGGASSSGSSKGLSCLVGTCLVVDGVSSLPMYSSISFFGAPSSLVGSTTVGSFVLIQYSMFWVKSVGPSMSSLFTTSIALVLGCWSTRELSSCSSGGRSASRLREYCEELLDTEEALEWIRRGGEEGMVAMTAEGVLRVCYNQLNTCVPEQCCLKVVGGRKETNYDDDDNDDNALFVDFNFLRFRKSLSRPSRQ